MPCGSGVPQGVAVKVDVHHVAAGSFHGFLDCRRHFSGLAASKANPAVAVADNRLGAVKPKIRPPFTTLATRFTRPVFRLALLLESLPNMPFKTPIHLHGLRQQEP